MEEELGKSLEAMVIDQAMDVDMDIDMNMNMDTKEPPIVSSVATSTTEPSTSITSRRSLPNSVAGKRGRAPLRHLPGTKTDLSSLGAGPHARNGSNRVGKKANVSRQQQKQKSRAKKAIVGAHPYQLETLLKGVPLFPMLEKIPKQFVRLDEYIVAQALCVPVPGLTFTVQPTSCLSETEMGDLIQALDTFQRRLAKKGNFIPSVYAGKLVKRLVQDLLVMALWKPERFGSPAEGHSFWWHVIDEYRKQKFTKHQLAKVEERLKSVPIEELPLGWIFASLAARRAVILEAFDDWVPYPRIVDVVTSIMEGEDPEIVSIQSSTLGAILRHFEDARARYLSNLNESHGLTKPKSQDPPKPTRVFGMPEPSRTEDGDSGDEHDGKCSEDIDSGTEDNGQIEGKKLRGINKSFVASLDKWIALKGGQQQGSIDVDMFSALALTDTK